MAMNPNTAFPSRTTAPSSGYPYGGAQNVSAPDDGTGTPWIASLINDVFGFQQSLLTQAGITPTNTPDAVGASQYIDALNAIYFRVDGSVALTGTLTSALTEGLVIQMDNYAVDVTGDDLIFGNYSSGAFRSTFTIGSGDEILIRAHKDGAADGATISMEDDDLSITYGSTEGVVFRTKTPAEGGVYVTNTLTGSGEERVLTVGDKSLDTLFIDSDSVASYTFTVADLGRSLYVTGASAFNFVVDAGLPVGFWVNVTNHSTNTIGTLLAGGTTLRPPAGGSSSFPVDGYGTYGVYDDATSTTWWRIWGLTE